MTLTPGTVALRGMNAIIFNTAPPSQLFAGSNFFGFYRSSDSGTSWFPFNNGIVATPDGRLIVVQMVAGRLVSVDPATGASTVVDLHGYSVVNGDGLVLRGHLLYVVRNVDNKVAVLRLDRRFASGVPVRELTSPLLRVPSTADLFGPWLYLVNARFDVTPTPTTDYNVVRVRA